MEKRWNNVRPLALHMMGTGIIVVGSALLLPTLDFTSTAGAATSTLLEMLEDKERRLNALADAADRSLANGVPERLGRVLDRLPELVQERLSDLDALLADKQIERGKQILAAFNTKIMLHPCGDCLEVEITGRIEGVFTLLGSTGGQKRWLGEEDSNPR